MCQNNNPAIDVAYALTVSTRGQERIKDLEKWQRIYYDKFVQEMNAFGFDGAKLWPWEDFLKDYDHYYAFSFTFAIQHAQVQQHSF